MKNIYLLLLALLIVSTSFAQYTMTKEGLKAVKNEVKQVSKPVDQTRDVLLDEGFEDATFPPTGWTTVDQDGDGYNAQPIDIVPTGRRAGCIFRLQGDFLFLRIRYS